jgi:hypothetical protein
MAKLTVIAAFLLAATASVGAFGQDNKLLAPELAKPAPGQLLDKDYLTSTGETVPRPGVPQASGPTALDRKIQEEDNRSTTASARGADPPVLAPSEDGSRPYSTVTCVFTELAMKQISWASWCRRSSSAFEGAAPAHSIFGRSFTLVTASRPGAISAVVPSAWSS